MEAAAAAAAAAVSYVTDVENLKATELRLGLPGTEEAARKTAVVVPSPPSTPRGSKRTLAGEESAREEAKKLGGETAPPAAKAQVVGWPPVRAYRKSCFQASSKSKAAQQEESATAAPAVTAGNGGSGVLYVKVSMDGAPYLRKIDLKMYKGYRELREALEAMFLCFPGGADNGGVNPSDFAVTYEDKDGDLMLVGDVPFEMFIGTCKRLRIMKGSEARGLGSSRE